MNIYRFMTGPIQVNTYVAYDDNKTGFIVDPGGRDLSMEKLLKDEKIDLQYIILTHGHGDHIGGIDRIRELYPDIRIVAAEAEKELLEDPRLNTSIDFCGRAMTVLCDLYVHDEDTLKIGDMELRFLMTPGHTKGGMCIVTDGYVFCGDTLFFGSIGRTDLYGGDYRALIDSVRNKIFTLPDDTLCLPGHMRETTVGFEKKHNPFF